MQENFGFSKPMIIEEVMQLADHDIGSLATIECLVSQVVHLSWNSFAMDPKNTTFPRNKEVHGAWLEGTRWIMNLLKGKNENLSFDIVCY